MIRAAIREESGWRDRLPVTLHHVRCGRQGCDQPIGYLDLGHLSLSRQWQYQWRRHTEDAQPLWRLGKRSRPSVRGWTRIGDPAPTMRGWRPEDDETGWLSTDEYGWRIPLPTVVRCPRCGTVQEVASPLPG